MKLSIALCTYNGAAFLGEQLASIEAQAGSVDEVVVCDDRSSDATVTILEDFARRMAGKVKVIVNPTNLGSTSNFGKAISLCTGDLIVLADQDDVWAPHKLARLRVPFVTDPAVGLVCSNATLVDEHLRPTGSTLWEAIEFGPAERKRFQNHQAFDCLLRRFRITGAMMAFRSRFRDLILPIPNGWVHDAWIGLLVSAVAECRLVEEPLVLYRQHARQQIGGRKQGLLGQFFVARKMSALSFEEIARQFADALVRLQGRPDVPRHRIVALAEKVRHAQARAHLRDPGVRRLPVVRSEWWKGNYSRYSRGWKAIAQDLVMD